MEQRNYLQFASLYDRLMGDAPYDMWLRFFTESTREQQVESVLDVGCGTGEFTVRLAEIGYEVTGVDLSEEMLSIARKKAERSDVSIPFFLQDMRELQGHSSMDAAVIFCDSLNYLRNPEDVDSTFKAIHRLLKEDGFLLFDVHSLHKIVEIFGEEVFTYNSDDITYLWECHPGEDRGSVYHDLTFFVRMDEDLYQRYDETHFQRTYPLQTYEELLEMNGFVIESITADFSDRKPSDVSERLFFVAKKKRF